MSDIILAEPTRLWLGLAGGSAALLAGLVVGRRHWLGDRVMAGVIRFAALFLVGVVLASPSVEATSESRLEPQGHWRLWFFR